LRQHLKELIQTFPRKPELQIPGIFPGAVDDDFFIIVGKPRRFYFADPDSHPQFPSARRRFPNSRRPASNPIWGTNQCRP